MLKWFLHFLTAAALVILQTSFWNTLPFFRYFDFVLFFIVCLSVKKSKTAIPAAIISGYLLDIYSSYPFGLHIFALTCAAFAANYIYFNILTNRRFLSVITLFMFEIILYHGALFFAISGLAFLKLIPKIKFLSGDMLKNIELELIYLPVSGSFIYLIYYFIKKKLSSRLLIGRYRSLAK